MSAPAYSVADFLSRIHAAKQIATNASVQVEQQADPKVIGRTAYRLVGATKGAVAARAARILDEAAELGGEGRFIGPALIDGGLYGSLGETIIPVTAGAL